MSKEKELRELINIDLVEKLFCVTLNKDEGFSLHKDNTIGFTRITILESECDWFISMYEYFEALQLYFMGAIK